MSWAWLLAIPVALALCLSLGMPGWVALIITLLVALVTAGFLSG